MRTVGVEYSERGKAHLVELGPPPALKPSEILIATRYSGITNGTERHALVGEHFWEGNFPSRHGYQCVGQVAARGEAVERFDEGDWVFCGQYIGHRGWVVADIGADDGGSYRSHLVIKLPDGVSPEHAALLGVAGVAMRGVRRCRVRAGDRVWTPGLGPIGQFAAQAARLSGAHVTVSDLNEDRLERALACGAHRALDAGDAGFWQALKEGAPYKAVLECSGAPTLLTDMFPHFVLAHGAAVCMLAVRVETPFNWGMLHQTEASLEVSCHFSLEDLEVLLYFLAAGQLQVEPLITHRPSIDEAPEIYAALRDRPGDMLGVVFRW